jgi:hypothetical protein
MSEVLFERSEFHSGDEFEVSKSKKGLYFTVDSRGAYVDIGVSYDLSREDVAILVNKLTEYIENSQEVVDES